MALTRRRRGDHHCRNLVEVLNMPTSPKYSSYFFTLRTEKGNERSIGFADDLEALRATIERDLTDKADDQEVGSESPEEEKIESTDVALGEEMGRALEIGLSQNHLIMISDVMGNMTAASMLNSNVRSEFAKDENLIEKGRYGLHIWAY
jgi:hypothetical protein